MRVRIIAPGCENNSCWEWVGQAESVEKSWKTWKLAKLPKFRKNNKQVKKLHIPMLLFFGFLLTLQVFMFFMIFQLIPPVLLFPTNYCFLNQVIPPLSGVLGNKSRPLNIDIMYSEISSEMQDCLFSNLGIVGNMKPTDISWYFIPGKAYRLRHVNAKTRRCLVYVSMSYQRHEKISCFI